MKTKTANHRNVPILAVCVNLLALALWPAAFADPGDSMAAILPFEFYEGHMILTKLSMVGTHGPLRVMIDTGASHSVINRRTAKRLNLSCLAGMAASAQAFDGGSEMELVILRGLRFAGHTLTIVCYTGELPWDKVDPMLGLDVLRNQDFRIDYKARQITFAPSGTLEEDIAFAFQEGLLLVHVQIGQEAYRLSIDTGAAFTTLHRNRCGASIKSLRGEHALIRHLGGTSDVQTVTVPEMQIGDQRIESVPTLIVSGSTKTQSVRDGVMGPKSLGFNAVQFDFSHNRMSFEF